MAKRVTIISIIILSLIFIHCPRKAKEDDNKKNQQILLAAYIADQSSGNCLIISKEDTENYGVKGISLPKGGCNESTIKGVYTTDLSFAQKSKEDFLNESIQVLSLAGSECDQAKAYFETLKNQNTVESLNQAVQSDPTGCIDLGEQHGPKIVLCKDQNSIDEERKKIRYVTTVDVKEDMNTSYKDSKNSLKLSQNSNGWTDLQISALQLLTSGELSVLSSPKFTAYLFSSAYSSCSKNMIAKNPDLKNVLVRLFGKTVSNITGITDVSSYIPAVSSLYCGYGTNYSGTKCDRTDFPKY